MKAGIQTVAAYVAAQPAPARRMLARVRTAIRNALPGASEGISYQIPVYTIDGAMVLYFAGFKRHYSIYPATAGVVHALEEELAGYLHSKATLRFPYDEPVPTRLITRVAKLRAAEAKAKPKAKAKAKAKTKPKAKSTSRARAKKR